MDCLSIQMLGSAMHQELFIIDGNIL